MALAPFVLGDVHVSHDGRRLRGRVRSEDGLATTVVRALDGAHVTVDDVIVHQASLDDVFFALTGQLRNGSDEAARRPRRRPEIRAPVTIDARAPAPPRVRQPRPLGCGRKSATSASWPGATSSTSGREPLQLSDVTIQPVLFTVLFVYILGAGVVLPGGGTYVDFAIAGLLGMNLVTSSMGTAVGLSTDLNTGVIDRFRTLPMWRPAVLVGRSVTDLFTSVVCAAIVAVTALVIGWRPDAGIGQVLGGFALMLLFAYTLSWGCGCLGLVSKGPESAQGIGLVILFPAAIVSNAFVPTQHMPTVMRVFANWNPISTVTDACRQLWGNPNPSATIQTWPMQHTLRGFAAVVARAARGLRSPRGSPVPAADDELTRPATASRPHPEAMFARGLVQLADEGFDLLDELVLDLEVPGRLGDVDDEEQIRDQQRLDGRDAQVLQPLPIPTFTVKSFGCPVIEIERARSASMTSRRNPPFFAWITTPSELGDEVWVVKPSDLR